VPEKVDHDGPVTKDDRMKNTVLVTLADGNYVNQAKQLFSSVYWNAGWKGDYLLLACEIPEKELRWFRDKGILVKQCKPVLTTSESRIGHAPLTSLCKFHLFTPEFRKWKNIVFLDGDIIVRGSLDALARIEGFGAVRILNLFRTTLEGQFVRRSTKNEHLFQELERRVELSRPAFNSGVMAFCTDIISADDFDKITDLLLRFKDIIFISEETVLNIYFYDTWRELSQVYNMCPSYEMCLSACGPDKLKGIVLHTYSNFPGGKPWNPKSPLRSEWQLNLNNASLIDLANPRAAENVLSKAHEAGGDLHLKNLHKRYSHKFRRYKIAARFWARVYRLRKRTDIFLKENYPRVHKLRRMLRNTA